MGRIISIVNQKGGVGKTTSAINLGAYLASYGRFVLLVDIDPQGNATSGVGAKKHEVEEGIYEAIIGTRKIHDIIIPSSVEGYSLVPATMSLAGANVELVNIERREFRLYDTLLEIKHNYDYILIDCPPSLGLLTINGLTAAEEILVPVQCEYYALEGLGQLLETIKLIKQNIKPNIDILGAVLTMFDKRNRLSEAVMSEIYQYFPDKIFRSVIPRNVALAEAPSHGKTILHYDPRSKGAKAYDRLAREIIETE